MSDNSVVTLTIIFERSAYTNFFTNFTTQTSLRGILISYSIYTWTRDFLKCGLVYNSVCFCVKRVNYYQNEITMILAVTTRIRTMKWS